MEQRELNTVSIPISAMTGGSCVARVTFMSKRSTIRNIRRNLCWAFACNVSLIPVAGVLYPFFAGGSVPEVLTPVLGEYGFLNPILAAAAMALSSVPYSRTPSGCVESRYCKKTP